MGLALLWAAKAAAAMGPFEQDMGKCMAEQSRQAAFSGIVAAGKGDERFVRSGGFADAQSRVTITRDTPFRLASVGKVFTRVAIGLLVDGGSLRLDDSVRRHVPELPESFASITLAQLLDHRSGVAPMTHPAMDDAPVMAGADSARDLVALVAAKPLGFTPGSQQQYSNGGYLLLGAVIEAASGQSYRSFVDRQIFATLGMKSSGFEPGPEAAVPLTRLTAPGQPSATTPQPRMEFAALKASSAGDALSSAADMEALALALIGDRLLAAPTKAAVFGRSQPWRLGQLGGAAGSNTVFWVFPDSGSWLIVLSNFDPPAGELMGQTLLPVLAGQSCKTLAPRAMPAPGPNAPFPPAG
jgi:CubicO group peptidase (beta-lactamase class C family)